MALLRIALVLVVAALPAHALEKITVSYGPGYPWISAFVAKDHGIFERHGLEVSLQFIPVGSNQPAALIGGSSQIAGVNPSIVIFADEGGAEIQIIAGANGQAKSASTNPALARAGTEIATPADFVGKRIGVPGINSVIHVAFMKWLTVKGVDPKSPTYVEVPINRMNDMLASGEIDVALPAAPFTDQILGAKTGHLVADYASDLADPFTSYSVWAMTRDYRVAHPEVVAAFRASITEALADIAANPDAARKTLVTYLKLPEPVAQKIRLVGLVAEVTPAQIQWWIDTCRELGLTKGTAQLADVLAE